MEWFLSLIRTLSVLSVVLAAIWMLAPRGSMEKSFRFTLGIFVLGAILSAVLQPIQTALPSFDRQETAYVATSQEISLINTEYAIRKLLENESIFCKNITLITDNSESDSIHITKARVELYAEEDWPRAAEIVLRETGIELVGGPL